MRGQEVQAGTAAADRASREAIAEAGRTTTERGQNLTAKGKAAAQEAAILRAQISQLNQALKLEDRSDIKKKRQLEIDTLERQLNKPLEAETESIKLQNNIKVLENEKEAARPAVVAYHNRASGDSTTVYRFEEPWFGTNKWTPVQLPRSETLGRQLTVGDIRKEVADSAKKGVKITFEEVLNIIFGGK